MKFTFKYQMSDKFLEKEILDTGVKGNEVRSLTVELSELTRAQRKNVMRHGQKYASGYAYDHDSLTLKEDPWNPSGTYSYWEKSWAELDKEPENASEAIDLMLKMIKANKAIEAQAKKLYEAHKKTKQAEAEKAHEREEESERVAKLKESFKKKWKIEKIDTLKELGLVQAKAEDLEILGLPAHYDNNSIFALIIKRKHEIIIRDWADEYGSDRLIKAAKRGYDVETLYITERAIHEGLVSFIYDEEEKADWHTDFTPTLEQIEMLENVEQLELGTANLVKINSYYDEENRYHYRDETAILIEDYLGKYQLFKII